VEVVSYSSYSPSAHVVRVADQLGSSWFCGERLVKTLTEEAEQIHVVTLNPFERIADFFLRIAHSLWLIRSKDFVTSNSFFKGKTIVPVKKEDMTSVFKAIACVGLQDADVKEFDLRLRLLQKEIKVCYRSNGVLNSSNPKTMPSISLDPKDRDFFLDREHLLQLAEKMGVIFEEIQTTTIRNLFISDNAGYRNAMETIDQVLERIYCGRELALITNKLTKATLPLDKFSVGFIGYIERVSLKVLGFITGYDEESGVVTLPEKTRLETLFND